MAEAPTQAAAAPQTPQAAAPPSTPAQGPPASTPTQTPPAPPTAQPMQNVDPHQIVTYVDESGRERTGTMAEMAHAHSMLASGGKPLTAEQFAEYDLWNKAFKQGDQAALNQVVQRMLPTQQQPQTPDPNAQMAQVMEQVRRIEQTLSGITPLTTQINNAREVSTIQGTIKQYAMNLPFLSGFPDQARAASEVHSEWKNVVASDPHFHQRTETERTRMYADTLRAVEARYQSIATAFGGKPGGQQPPPAAPPVTPAGPTPMANDQGNRAAPPGYIPPPFIVQGGQIVPNPAFQGMAPNAPAGGANGTIPTQLPPLPNSGAGNVVTPPAFPNNSAGLAQWLGERMATRT
ncbi:MAG: hypothetical protein ACKV2Q_36505 [Planctomycetaceae bacterium]